MSFPHYPKYKESGVEWLGRVPEHWEMLRLGSLFREIAEPGHAGLPILSVSIHDGVSDKEMSEEDMDRKVSRSDDLSKYVRVQPKDLVYNMMRAWQGGFGTVCVDGMVSPAYVVARPRTPIETAYVEHLLRTPSAIEQLRRHSHGVTDFRLRLYWDEFKNIRVPLPPPSEQKAVVEYVARESATIEGLVAEQQRLMELLKEKRRAVISHAVTKGLNPDAPMKYSGIEWLGEMPAHWDVKRFQRCVYVREGQVDPEDHSYSAMPLIAPNHIESGTGRLLETESAIEQGAESGKYLCQAGDVIYSKIRPALRKVCITPHACLCSADMYPLRAHSGLTNSFLLWSMLSEWFSALAILESQRVAMPKVNRESLKEVLLPVPPIEEQAAIAKSLESMTGTLDALCEESRRAIELLQERRTALISAAVTGQIDVRQLAEKQAAA